MFVGYEEVEKASKREFSWRSDGYSSVQLALESGVEEDITGRDLIMLNCYVLLCLFLDNMFILMNAR